MNHSSESVVITVLMENRSPSEGLCCEHGLSFHIRTPGASVLFDTGQSGDFVKNAETLGIDLSALDAVVFSHGHYDHTDGFSKLKTGSKVLPIYIHPDAVVDRYSIKDRANPKYVGINTEALELLKQHECRPVTEPTAICEEITCTGPVPRLNDFEDTGGPFFLDKEGVTEDPIVDDQSLIIRTSKGIVLLLGCAHSGVSNTIRLCERVNPGEKIHAIIGGFHLLNADQNRLDRTIQELRALDVKMLAPCHCTGVHVMELLEREFPASYADCRVGTRFEF